MTEEERVRGVVLGVIRNRLTDEIRIGVLLVPPPSPEGALLRRWIEADPSMEIHEPDPEAVAALREALRPWNAEASEAMHLETRMERLAYSAAAHYTAPHPLLLPVDPAHKLQLLLERRWAPCFPLGDLWPSQVEGWLDEEPSLVHGFSREELPLLEAALRRALDQGFGIRRVLGELPQRLGLRVGVALERSRPTARPPLVPKLGPWTLGIDPPH